MRRSRRKNHKLDDATSELTPKRGGEFVGGDTSLRDEVPDPGSVQSNHAMRGYGGDDEHADADDVKVQGRSRG